MFTLFKKDDGNSVHVSEIDHMIEEINLIDIREPYEVAYGRIKSARNIPMDQLLSNPGKYLDKNKRYHLICQSGARSQSASTVLVRSGYDVINVKGGMGSYHGKHKVN